MTLHQVYVPSLHPETQAARDLLERWSRQGFAQQTSGDTPLEEAMASSSDQAAHDESETYRVEDSFQEFAPVDLEPADDGNTVSPATDNANENLRAWRIDAAHPDGARSHVRRKRSGRLVSQERNSMESARERDAAHRSDRTHHELPDPHFDTTRLNNRPRPGHSEAAWGQVLAYSGVGVLTVGTVFVVWGYFAGIENYASTGWLLSTAGQMLLLLGVVTLVSGGMQQTTHEVSQRIEFLNGRMYRIERSTQKILRGPHFGSRSRRSRSARTSGPDVSEAE